MLLGKGFDLQDSVTGSQVRSLHITQRTATFTNSIALPANSKQFRKANNTYTQYRRVIGTVTEPGAVLKYLTETIPLNSHKIETAFYII